MKQNLSARVFLALWAGLLASGLGAPLIKAQAAGEYGVGVSKSVAGAVSAGNTMRGSTSKAAGTTSEKLQAETRESAAEVMKENRAALAKEAGESGGTLRLASEPSDAAVFVDGRLVARTPAEVKVPPGKHQIEITRPDRQRWSEQSSVAKGQTVNINGKLVSLYPSVITLDFKDSKK
jgi:hypothetical protein